MHAAKNAPRDSPRVLERRHGLAEIVERGAVVKCPTAHCVDGAALRALLAHGADEVSVVSNAPFALQKELSALRAAAGCPRSRA